MKPFTMDFAQDATDCFNQSMNQRAEEQNSKKNPKEFSEKRFVMRRLN
jgi:hypothetical protein